MQLPYERSLYFFTKKQQERKKWINCGRRFGKPSLILPSLAKETLSPEDYERFMQEYKKVVEQTEREYGQMREIMQHREGYSFVAVDEIEE